MSKSKLLATVLGAAAAGAVLGLLLAPKSGKDTRKQILKTTRKSADSLEQILEDSKRTWFETKGKAEKGVGVAANEVDDFMRHIISKGKSFWKNAKSKTSQMADDAEETLDTVANNGKKATNYVKDHVS
ncbi:MAG: YtxH domain-containing protein [Lewinellaceae bacterium]|nr:YtxH domain-containing protein [Lewinellaceae bacterium]